MPIIFVFFVPFVVVFAPMQSHKDLRGDVSTQCILVAGMLRYAFRGCFDHHADQNLRAPSCLFVVNFRRHADPQSSSCWVSSSVFFGCGSAALSSFVLFVVNSRHHADPQSSSCCVSSSVFFGCGYAVLFVVIFYHPTAPIYLRSEFSSPCRSWKFFAV